MIWKKLKKITPVADSEGSSSGVSPLDEPDDSSDDLDDGGADGYEEARAAIVKHNVSLVSTAAGADVQVIDGNSDGSDSTGRPAGRQRSRRKARRRKARRFHGAVISGRNGIRARNRRRGTEVFVLLSKRQGVSRTDIRRNTIKEAGRKAIHMFIFAKKEQRFRHLS